MTTASSSSSSGSRASTSPRQGRQGAGQPLHPSGAVDRSAPATTR
jgi:hypothetical protein